VPHEKRHPVIVDTDAIARALQAAAEQCLDAMVLEWLQAIGGDRAEQARDDRPARPRQRPRKTS
jgi:hypothetical protein